MRQMRRVLGVLSALSLVSSTSICKYENGTDLEDYEKAGMPRKVLKWEELGSPFCYSVGLCEELSNATDDAVVRYQGNCDSGIKTVFGKINKSSFLINDGVALLSYNGGDICDKTNTSRSVKIIYTISPDGVQRTKVFDQTEKDCSIPLIIVQSYLSKDTDAPTTTVTPKNDDNKGWSSGGIFCLVFFIFVLVYLIGGTAYRRFALHATGRNQIPNYGFWQKVGSLAADGCDMCCRCRDLSQSNRNDGFPSYGGSIQNPGMSPFSTNSPRMSTDDNILQP